MTELSIRLDNVSLFRQAFEFLLKDIAANRFDVTGELFKAEYHFGLISDPMKKDVPAVIVNALIDEKRGKEKPKKNLNIYYKIIDDENGRYLNGEIILKT